MTPAARLQAAIELLDAIIASARDAGPAADTLIARYFAARRYAGSKDRRAVRELVYDAIRSLGERPDSGRAAMIGHARARQPELLALFGEGPHAPAALGADETGAAPGLAPAWLVERFRAGFGDDAGTELAALLTRAPLDVRINTLKPSGFDEGAALAHAPHGRRLAEGARIEASPAFRDGLIEVQDEGSQLACLAVGARPGELVVDLCAGAGGKSLGLAAAMANRGCIVACDTDRARLQRLGPRAERAGATIIETRLLDPGREAAALADLAGRADRVLIDAPCSGTGTWRRNPEARWRLTPARIARLVELQARLMDLAATLLRPGGTLAYVVCSLLPEEGAAQANAFAARHPNATPAPLDLPVGLIAPGRALLTPARHGCDGFSVSTFTTL